MSSKLFFAVLASMGLLFSCSGKDKEVVEVIKEKSTPIVQQPVIIDQPVLIEKTGISGTVKDMVSTAKTITGDVACTAGEDTRKIQVTTNNSGCQVVYTKFGAESEVANAANDMSYCESVSNKIQGNLSAAGFACTNQ